MGEISVRANVIWGTVHRGNVLSENCPFEELSVGELSVVEKSFREKSVGEMSVGELTVYQFYDRMKKVQLEFCAKNRYTEKLTSEFLGVFINHLS